MANTVEGRSYQYELSVRKGDTLGFTDHRLVRQVVDEIEAKLFRIKERRGEIVFPYPISRFEEYSVRRILARQHHTSGSLYRVESFLPIRLEEGMGTMIPIGKKIKYGRR